MYKVISDQVAYNDDCIITQYVYRNTKIENNNIIPYEENLVFKTITTVPKTGILLVGLGGNNGTTLTGGILANKHNISWNTKEGIKHPNYFGSMSQASTVRLGVNECGDNVYVPFNNLLPMLDPNSLVIGGWDINSLNLGDAMRRAQVLDYDLQEKLYPLMKDIVPCPSIYNVDFIASNQKDRADNIISGTKSEQLEIIRKNIRDFKKANKLEKVIVLWTANTERYCADEIGITDTAENILSAIKSNHDEISPSNIFAIASILEGCSYINGSPQNTFNQGIIELAQTHNVFIAGDDFKSGQTKIKSVLVDFLISAGIKPVSIVSYNHLGNNDGKNLSEDKQFKSKEISKSNVVEDMIESNKILYKENESPDHTVVIKYVPYVGDSKRAMDEYTSEIFMNGRNTIVMHNTCEDSLLATPIILDLIVLCELCERIQIKSYDQDDSKYERFHCVLSLLSYFLKAPLVPPNCPVVNALAAQRQCIVNVFKACIGIPPDNFMHLEHRVPQLMISRKRYRDQTQN